MGKRNSIQNQSSAVAKAARSAEKKPRHSGKVLKGSSETGDNPSSNEADLGKTSVNGHGDWRAELLDEIRRLIHDANPEIVEEQKWIKPTNPDGVPVWSHTGILCTGETYKQVVKVTFARGAALKDPRQLLNAGLEGKTRRAIDFREGAMIPEQAFKALVRSAIEENIRVKNGKTASSTKTLRTSPKKPSRQAEPVVLLSGGNPQIAKGDGDGPVQAYINAMPGWKRAFGERLDALIVKSVPGVTKAVKWNSPFYGVKEQGWFLSFHVFTHYVKVTFFAGTSLRPVPPGGTPKSKEVRWIDIKENDNFDETQLSSWIRQAAAIPGWMSGK